MKLTQRQAFIQAVGLQESGGHYSDVNSSSGALGKYQVMPSNLTRWTTEALGHALTPQQYLADPAAQDAVADKILGGYYDKYGAAGAASAWYSGNPSLYNSTAPQPGGPSVSGYVQSVLAKMSAILGGKVTVTTPSDPGVTSSTTTASTGGLSGNDWIFALDNILNPDTGGVSLNPLKDISNTGKYVELVAARVGIAAVGLIGFGAGLLLMFGRDIFGRSLPVASAVADRIDPPGQGSRHAARNDNPSATRPTVKPTSHRAGRPATAPTEGAAA